MTSPLVVSRTDLVRVSFHGDKAALVLNGLVSNDVAALASGQGCYAVALTPKGRIVADLRIMRLADRVVTEAVSAAGPGWLALVRKYVNPRLARYTDDTAETAVCEVVGVEAPGVVTRATATSGLALHAHAKSTVRDLPVVILRIPDYGVPAYAISSRAADGPAVLAELVRAGATLAPPDDLEVLRVEAGRPRWGSDMDESMLAQEANMDEHGAISYTKGCYTGQEFVARLHYRGHVNRHLRGMLLDAPAPRGALVTRTDASPLGELRSSVTSPRLGAIAMAMLRREANVGDRLNVAWDGGNTQGVVVDLPFPA